MSPITLNNLSEKPIISNYKPIPLLACMQKNWLLCMVGSILSFMLASILLSGWPAGIWPNLSFPFTYQADGLSHVWLAKRAIEGWIWDNVRCGYPFGSNLRDYPGSDSGNLLFIKLLGVLTGEYFKAVNLFILVSFPLAFTSAFILQLSLGLEKYFAFSSAMLFAFLPFHFQRLDHLFYLFYFVVPVYYYYAYQVLVYEKKSNKNIFKVFNLAAFVLLIILSSFGIYYALFGMIVIAAGGIYAAFNKRSSKPLYCSTIAIFAIVVGVFMNLAPTIHNTIENGPNKEVAVRDIGDAEIYGFKLAQLILPRDNHRVPQLAAVTQKYSNSAPLINENRSSSLGLFGAIGLFLAGCVLVANSSGRSTDPRISFLAVIALVLFLSGTIGGLGSLFAMTVTSSIRSWNRVFPFLSFACLAIFFIILQNCLNSFRHSKVVFPLAAFCILFAGLYDQTAFPAWNHLIIADTKNRFDADRSFIKQIESNLDPDSPIYQLPYLPFPEAPAINKLGHYELAIGYLHSKTLRWSYAGMKGRSGDLFYRALSKKSISDQLSVIKKLGFKGIYVDRRGFEDNAFALENELCALLPDALKIESINKTAFFIKLPPCEAPDFNNLKPFEILEKIGWGGVLSPGKRYSHSQTDYLTFQSWSREEKEWRWSLGKTCTIEFTIDSPDDFQGELILEGYSHSNQIVDILLNNTLIKTLNMDGSREVYTLSFPKGLLKNGTNKLTFLIPGAKKPDNGDTREVGFALFSFILK